MKLPLKPDGQQLNIETLAHGCQSGVFLCNASFCQIQSFCPYFFSYRIAYEFICRQFLCCSFECQAPLLCVGEAQQETKFCNTLFSKTMNQKNCQGEKETDMEIGFFVSMKKINFSCQQFRFLGREEDAQRSIGRVNIFASFEVLVMYICTNHRRKTLTLIFQVWSARSLQGIIYSLCTSWGAHSLPVGHTCASCPLQKIAKKNHVQLLWFQRFYFSGYQVPVNGSASAGTGCLFWWSGTSPSACYIRPT